MKHAALYVRVSSEEQKRKGLSVDNQIDSLIEFCKANDYTYTIYNDAGISGNITYKKRPAMMQLIQDCNNNIVDIILFTRLDRFFRSVKDYYFVMELVNNIPWNAIWQNYDISTAQGKMLLNMSLGLAQMESDIDSERIRSVLDYKKAKGEYVGRVPFGYIRVNGFLEKDPETAHVVEGIFQMFLESKTRREIHDHFAEEGFNISAKIMQNVLTNKIYCGIAQEGTCEPYITVEQFEEIQRIRKIRTRTAKKHRVYLFAGLLRCDLCNRSMVGTITYNQFKNTYKSYRCHGNYTTYTHTKQLSISEIKLEKYMIDHLDDMLSQTMLNVETKGEADKLKDYDKAKKRIENRLERIKFLFEEGDISVEEYRKKKKGLQNELNALHKPEKINTINLPQNWKDVYYDLSEDGRKAFWHSIIHSIIIGQSHDIVKVNFL